MSCDNGESMMRKSSKMLCPCNKCKESRGENPAFAMAAKSAETANNFAKVGGECLSKLASMIPWPKCDDDCDDKSKEDSKSKSKKKPKKGCQCKAKSKPKDSCSSSSSSSSEDDDQALDCDDNKTACLCAASPNAAAGLSCFMCECVATIGFFVIAIVVFWVSAGYHIGKMFCRVYKTSSKSSPCLQNSGNRRSSSGATAGCACN